MLFSSISFLYYFLPCVLIVYFLVPQKFRNFVLLIASLIFYAWGEPKYVILMAISIGIGYVSGLFIEKYRGRSLSRYIMACGVGLCLSFLGYFKYANFFADNFNKLVGDNVIVINIALPIGISFFTFQIISYIVDVYRGVNAQRNFISLAAYVSMFPQLIAGPIVRYVDIEKQLNNRSTNIDDIVYGIRRFTLGLGKKIFLANVLGEFCDIFHASTEKSIVFFWLYALSYALHVYFDFSGYSDMAIGLGRILGFRFLENFNYPFISKSATEFWRRWHMSLGTWFRDYVYIPLGGNRVRKIRWIFNIFVVWMLTGFWHGAAWNFVIWGLFFGIVLMIEKLWLLKWLEKSALLSRIYAFIILLVSFVIFGATDMGQAGSYIASMFGVGVYPLLTAECLYYLRSYGLILVLAMIGATPVVKNVFARLEESETGKKVLSIAEPIAMLVILFIATAYLVDGSFNPFLYFRF